ncbi:MAG TPA: LysE family translocator [Nodosilinea sp.]|nr:LysE family translocator [Nodosilinea sp.]
MAMVISAAVPGPGVLACVARAIASGFRSTLYIIGGILLGNLVFLMIAILGLVAAASALGNFFIAIKYLGALYLIWLGLRLWRSDVSANSVDIGQSQSSPWSSFLAGLVVPLSNSAVIVFYVSLLPTFLDLTRFNWADSLIAMGVISLALFLVLALYAYGAARAGRFFRGPRARQRLNRSAGTLMVGTGVYVALRRA